MQAAELAEAGEVMKGFHGTILLILWDDHNGLIINLIGIHGTLNGLRRIDDHLVCWGKCMSLFRLEAEQVGILTCLPWFFYVYHLISGAGCY